MKALVRLGLAACVLLMGWPSASRADTFFSASLIGGTADPPNASAGTGFARVTLNEAETEIRVTLGFTGLTGNTLAAHIHRGAPGVVGPVLFDLAPTTGATSGSRVNAVFPATPEQVTDLKNGLWYVNVHTTAFGDGEIRGQLGPDPTAVAILNPEQVAAGSTGAAASGRAFISISPTGTHLIVSYHYGGLSGSPIGVHIHGPAAPGTTGPLIAIFMTPVATSHQSGDSLFTITPAQAAHITNRIAYFDIHTPANPMGEVRGQIQPQLRVYLLAEGATGSFFDTDLLLANPNTVAVPLDVTFQRPDGTTVPYELVLPAQSRRTVNLETIPGLEETEVSASVVSTNGLPIAVERTMRWDATGYGGHTETAASGDARTWYFAEGSQGFFFTYLLLANPHPAANSATVTFLREGEPPVTQTIPLAPFERYTFDAGSVPELRDRSFGIQVAFDSPAMAERAMYFGTTPLFLAGHESAGVKALSTEWFLAEGATGPFFETFILAANPNATAADLTVRFLTGTGATVTRTKTVPPNARLTINVEAEGDPELTNAAVSTQVTSTVPIVVERAQYWPGAPSDWYEAHNSAGVTAAATRWALAEGRVGGSAGYQTYILLANAGTQSAQVTLTFLRETGAPVAKVVDVPANSRFTLSVGPGTLVPELNDESFGTHVNATSPIVVERALYWNAAGQIWAAGTNATATPLP